MPTPRDRDHERNRRLVSRLWGCENYQRLRPSPTTAQPRGAFPGAPPSVRGRARLTLMRRPFRSVPSSPWIAAIACGCDDISMKPKPLDRPSDLSVATVAELTGP